MKKIISFFLIACWYVLSSCVNRDRNNKEDRQQPAFTMGEFAYDLQFLKKQDSSLVVLKKGEAQVVVSPRYQSKVFTSTAAGDRGISFGWINYKAFDKKPDVHMNAFGGENRIWLGPEGGKYSLFFPPGSKMVFDNWKTPAPVDTESWDVKSQDSIQVSLYKEMRLTNYAGTRLEILVERTIKILDRPEITRLSSMKDLSTVQMVGYETENILTNKGNHQWTAETGMPCIWILDMFKPSPETVIVVPFRNMTNKDFSKIATTNYFGEIPKDRLRHSDSLLFFRADGKSRGKIGVTAVNAKYFAGSYDAGKKVLTIIQYDLNQGARYLNQEWNTIKPAFSGDAVNAYNDGPLANGTQMGPFYEIESVSPAAFLKPGESLVHKQTVLHFTGNEQDLDKLAIAVLGISLEEIGKTF